MLIMFRWAALIAAVVFVIAVAGAILSSQKSLEPSQQQTTEKNHKENTTKKNELALFDRWFPDSTAVFNLFLAIFTGVLAFGGLIQLNLLTRAERIATETAQAAKDSAEATKRAVELSDKTAERQLRAYIYVEKISVFLDGNTLRGIVDLKNAGQTPAYDMSVKSRLQIEDVRTPFRPTPIEVAELSRGIIGPGGVLEPRADLTIPLDNTTALPAIKDGRGIIYFIGHVEYRDAFQKVWMLDFQMRSHLFDGKQWILAPTPEGNQETEKK